MLTDAQLAVLKASIEADPVLNQLPPSSDSAFIIAEAYNADATPDFIVWRTEAPMANVYDAITWANFTPEDVPDGTAIYTNRALLCQDKQFNIQTMLMGRETVNASKANIRAGLQDALTAIPSGAGGANRSGGWTAVKAALTRTATRLEKLFATGTGDAANPATMAVEGLIGYNEVKDAMGW